MWKRFSKWNFHKTNFPFEAIRKCGTEKNNALNRVSFSFVPLLNKSVIASVFFCFFNLVGGKDFHHSRAHVRYTALVKGKHVSGRNTWKSATWLHYICAALKIHSPLLDYQSILTWPTSVAYCIEFTICMPPGLWQRIVTHRFFLPKFPSLLIRTLGIFVVI